MNITENASPKLGGNKLAKRKDLALHLAMSQSSASLVNDP